MGQACNRHISLPLTFHRLELFKITILNYKLKEKWVRGKWETVSVGQSIASIDPTVRKGDHEFG